MADESNKGPKPFPNAKEGASDDDIFAEMGRMLAQDGLNKPAPAKSASANPASAQSVSAQPMPAQPVSARPAPSHPAPSRPAPSHPAPSHPAGPPTAKAPPPVAGATDEPLELTQVIRRGKPPQAPADPPVPNAPIPKAQPAETQGSEARAATTVSQAAAMLHPERPPAAAPAPAASAAAASTGAAGATVSNRSLDAIVEDVARGMIREWLDANLERIAREEAAKAAAKASPET